MKKTIKNYAIRLYFVALVIVIIAKISNWFLHYSDETNDMLSTAMFCLIGIGYLQYSWDLDKFVLKLIVALCGLFLIVMKFLPDTNWVPILGIVCILTPMIIRKFLTKDEENMDMKTE